MCGRLAGACHARGVPARGSSARAPARAASGAGTGRPVPPRRYEGILNFNYKVRESGELCIFEINTRLGADLGCDVPTPMLREFFSRLDALQASREEQQARGAAPPAAG